MKRVADSVVLEITPDILLKAYACGIFPMGESADDPRLFWLEPEWRGIIPLTHFHVPRRLARSLRRDPFEIRLDTDFQGVLDGCAHEGKGRTQTWINERIRTLYGDLFTQGHCHTVECWREGELVGGLYGVALGAAFFGESMFSKARDASKLALVHLVARLLAGGYMLLDTQFLTEHLAQFGGIEISREAYRNELETALRREGNFHALSPTITGAEVLAVLRRHTAVSAGNAEG